MLEMPRPGWHTDARGVTRMSTRFLPFLIRTRLLAVLAAPLVSIAAGPTLSPRHRQPQLRLVRQARAAPTTMPRQFEIRMAPPAMGRIA